MLKLWCNNLLNGRYLPVQYFDIYANRNSVDIEVAYKIVSIQTLTQDKINFALDLLNLCPGTFNPHKLPITKATLVNINVIELQPNWVVIARDLLHLLCDQKSRK